VGSPSAEGRIIARQTTTTGTGRTKAHLHPIVLAISAPIGGPMTPGRIHIGREEREHARPERLRIRLRDRGDRDDVESAAAASLHESSATTTAMLGATEAMSNPSANAPSAMPSTGRGPNRSVARPPSGTVSSVASP
jgi:hypothetical protein